MNNFAIKDHEIKEKSREDKIILMIILFARIKRSRHRDYNYSIQTDNFISILRVLHQIRLYIACTYYVRFYVINLI